jgi:hypothetical protein
LDNETKKKVERTVFLDLYVLPKWGEVTLRRVRTTKVEKWLRKLKLAAG